MAYPYHTVSSAAMLIAANLAIRFLIELCALAALAYWGFTTPASTLAGLALAVIAPALAALAWGAFVAPRRIVEAAPPALRLLVEVAVIGSAAAGLVTAGSRGLGIALAAIWAVNKAILAVWYRPGEGTI
jgi:hypothetical protein